MLHNSVTILGAILVLGLLIGLFIGPLLKKRRESWVEIMDGRIIHIVPNSDLIPHLKIDCPCSPTQMPHEGEDGYMTWTYKHHAVDGRDRS